jgi:hypothetical protein
MKFSSQRDSKDRFFPDVMTLPTHKFQFSEPPTERDLTQQDKKRFDLRMFKEYELTELDDIVRFINRKPLIEDVAVGERMLFPSKTNLERFYNENFA